MRSLIFTAAIFSLLFFASDAGATDPVAQSLPIAAPVIQAVPIVNTPISPSDLLQNTTIPSLPGVPTGSSSADLSASSDCAEAASSAADMCGTPSVAGIDPSIVGAIAPLASAVLQGGSAPTPQQCQMQAMLQAAQSALSEAKASMCQQRMTACTSICDDDAQDDDKKYTEAVGNNDSVGKEKWGKTYTADRKKKAGCAAYAMNSMQMYMQMMSLNNNVQQMQSCQALAATPAPAPVAAMDCTNAAVASSSLMCYCQANPTDPKCTGVAANGTGLGSGATLSGPGGSAQPFSATGLAMTGTPVPLPAGTPGATSGSSQAAAGTAASGFGAPSPGGAAGLGDGQGSGSSGIDKGVITGTASGGGGGGGGLSAAGNPGGGGGGARFDNEGVSTGFNIRDFLAKKEAQKRGIAGMAVPGVDGITGAMGPSIWEKVSNQYQNQKPKLLLTPGK